MAPAFPESRGYDVGMPRQLDGGRAPHRLVDVGVLALVVNDLEAEELVIRAPERQILEIGRRRAVTRPMPGALEEGRGEPAGSRDEVVGALPILALDDEIEDAAGPVIGDSHVAPQV